MPSSTPGTVADPSVLAPLRKEIVVRCRPQRAFAVLTAGIADWWPLASHSVAGARAAGVTFEGRVGGRLVETDSAGGEHVWGTVLRWDPPREVAFTWHPGRAPDTAQEVVLRFAAIAEGSRVVLVHSGWAALGDDAATVRAGYDPGWDLVFGEHYRGAAEAG